MERDSLLRKIKHLMRVTEERGATEQEAITATKKVGELLEKYNLSMSEVDLRETSCTKDSVVIGKVRAHAVEVVGGPIADYVGVRAWVKRDMDSVQVVFFGMPHDVEVAVYLLALCQNATDREWSLYKKSPSYIVETTYLNGNSVRASFYQGITNKLAQRIEGMELKQRMAREDSSESTALMVVRNEVVDQEFDRLNMDFGKAKKSNQTTRSDAAYMSGRSAADDVTLNKGIGQKAAVVQIEVA